MENNQIFEMADRLKAMREQKKDLEAQAKALGAEIDALDLQMSDAMTETELDRFSRNGSMFYLKSWLFASPVAGRRDEMIASYIGHTGRRCEFVPFHPRHRLRSAPVSHLQSLPHALEQTI